MSLSEFSLIDRYFARRAPTRRDVVLGIGDDAAVLEVPPGMQLVTATDTLVADVHFPLGTAPAAIGHKSLAVNLSDLAAMGAQPAWATLVLSLPEADADWLEAFSQGFFALCERYGVELVGGDTTRGPLAVTVQAMGLIPPHRMLRRGGARVADRIFVTGTLGDAGLGLRLLQAGDGLASSEAQELLRRLEYPEPRIASGIALRDIASAAIDVSDGLIADLGHILDQSGVGAELCIDRVPTSGAFQHICQHLGIGPGTAGAVQAALSGGDDYELCFTVPPYRVQQLEARADLFQSCTQIGVIQEQPGLRCVWGDGREFRPEIPGYQHFA
jgi:thiamine-monophosphate kinase